MASVLWVELNSGQTQQGGHEQTCSKLGRKLLKHQQGALKSWRSPGSAEQIWTGPPSPTPLPPWTLHAASAALAPPKNFTPRCGGSLPGRPGSHPSAADTERPGAARCKYVDFNRFLTAGGDPRHWSTLILGLPRPWGILVLKGPRPGGPSS